GALPVDPEAARAAVGRGDREDPGGAAGDRFRGLFGNQDATALELADLVRFLLLALPDLGRPFLHDAEARPVEARLLAIVHEHLAAHAGRRQVLDAEPARLPPDPLFGLPATPGR